MLTILALTVLACLSAYLSTSFFYRFYPFLASNSLKKIKNEAGKWALVTGASDGIGKEFAMQLAKSGLNLILVSRSFDKLTAIKTFIETSYAVNVEIFAFDFTKPFNLLTTELEPFLHGKTVSILVNNVAMNHVFPVSFLDESDSNVLNIINVNTSTQLMVTKLIAHKMILNKRGLILNIGSVAGHVPSGHLSVYSATKAFLRFWSNALAMELSPFDVHVEHVTAYFVVTNMSKMRVSWLSPSAHDFVSSVLSQCWIRHESVPYYSHALVMWILQFIPESLLIWYSNKMHVDIRRRALKKQERMEREEKSRK